MLSPNPASTRRRHGFYLRFRPLDWMMIQLVPMLILWLSGCQPARLQQPNASLVPDPCDEPGVVEPGSMQGTQRGQAYHYQVYLPPCYDGESGRPYPVLYLIPGSGSGPAAWFSAGVAEIADEMMMGGQIPPFLIVATESTDADPYGETINDELIPFVDSAYSTRSGSQNRAIAGASLGGVGAYRIFFGHPGRFGSLAVFGSGVMPGEETQVRRWIDDFPAGLRPRVFLNTGEEDVAALRWAQATKGMLDNAGIETRSVFTSGRHTYAYWVSNFADYFLWLADAW